MAKREEYVPGSYRIGDRLGYYENGQYRTHQAHFAKPKVPISRRISHAWRSLNRPREIVGPIGFHNWKALGLIVLLGLGIVFLADQALKKPGSASPILNLDPNLYQTIYHAQAASGDLNEFSCAGGGTASYQTGLVAGGKQLRMNTDNGRLYCQSKVTVGDLSIVAAKHLASQFFWKQTGGTWTQAGLRFMMFLTRNATVSALTTYNPQDDINVALAFTVEPSGVASQYTAYLFIQKKSTESINTEDTGGCGQSSSCYLSQAITAPVMAPATNIVQSSFWLNYTGNARTVQGTSCAASGSFPQGGGGCSVMIVTNVATVNPWTGSGTSTASPFEFQATDYYLGFYVPSDSGQNPQIDILFDAGTLPASIDPTNAGTGMPGSMALANSQIISTLVNIAPSLDTGGFFGPVIRFLVSGAIFIFEGIVKFLGWVADIILTGLNAMGNFVGLGNLGTAIRDTFTGFVTWINSVLSVTVGQALNTATAIGNIITTVVTSASSFFAGVTGVFAEITNLFSYFWSSVANVWKIGTLGFKWIVMADLVAGIMMSLHSVAEFQRWVWIQWNIVLGLLRVIMAIGEKVTDLIAKIRTIGPRPAGI